MDDQNKVLDLLQEVLVEQKNMNQRIGRIEGDINVMKHDIVDMKHDIVDMKQDIVDMKQDISDNKNDINNLTQTVLRIELHHGEKLGLLIDGQIVHTEAITEIRTDIKEMKKTQENHDLNITWLKSNKAK